MAKINLLGTANQAAAFRIKMGNFTWFHSKLTTASVANNDGEYKFYINAQYLHFELRTAAWRHLLKEFDNADTIWRTNKEHYMRTKSSSAFNQRDLSPAVGIKLMIMKMMMMNDAI